VTGLGQLLPPWGQQRDLCQHGPCELPSPVAVGQATTSAQAARMDSPQVFSPRCRQPLGFLRHDPHEPGQNPGTPVDSTGLDAHHTAHQRQSRSEPVGPAMGRLLRSPSGREDGRYPAGTAELTVSLAGARRQLSGVSAVHHAADRLASLPHRLALERGHRRCSPSGVAASQRSPASP
jgi:hypothetical protein